MCTFILAWRVFPDTPIVVAANRDEVLDRPSTPPHSIDTTPRIHAPRDEEAGGTWIGYNERGVVASITNRWTDSELDADRSRGLLVTDALEQPSADAAVQVVEAAVESASYAGFNLVVVDDVTAYLVEWDGRLRITPFDPGVHVVVNVGADTGFDIPATHEDVARSQAENARRALTELTPEPGEEVDGWLDRAVLRLRDHEYGFCVHGDGFGTRSSSLITVGADGAVSHEYADGPPCETEYDTVEDTFDVTFDPQPSDRA